MPRILIAHPSPDSYGSDRQLLESIEALKAAGWQITLCLPEGGPLSESLVGVDVLLVQFPVLRKAMLRPWALVRLGMSMLVVLARLILIIRTCRAEVVYVNTVTIPWWIVAARIAGRPVLVHVHEAEEYGPRAARIVLAAPLLLATSVVANSSASRAVLTSAIPCLASRTSVVYNGLPDHGVGDPSGCIPGKLALVGRLSPRKGIDVALDAVALLRRSGRSVSIDICGSAFAGYEWYEAKLRERAYSADLVGAVNFAGFVHRTKDVLERASIVVVPSRCEPFGNVAVEGLLAGRPVVASNIQGLPEIIDDGETGLLVESDDPSALAATIAHLLDDPVLRDHLASSGRTSALARFSQDRYRSEILDSVTRLHPLPVAATSR